MFDIFWRKQRREMQATIDTLGKQLVEAELKNRDMESAHEAEVTELNKKLEDSARNAVQARDRFIRKSLFPLFNLSDQELEEKSGFAVYGDDNPHFVTAMCSVGGCEFRVVETGKTKRDALLHSCMVTEMGEKMDVHSACPDCYAEYMREACGMLFT